MARKKSTRTGFRAKSKQGREIKERLQPKAILCTVCGKADGKYKCPKCRAPFCCVQCSKEHKANHCTAVTTDDATGASTNSSASTANNNNEQSSNYLSKKELKPTTNQPQKKRIRGERDEDSDDDEPGWNITPEMKKLVHQSTWLRKELQDGGLRQLIGQIDAASDDEEEQDGGGGGGIRKNNNSSKRKLGHHGDSKSGITPRELALARTKHSHDKFASFIDRMLLTVGVLQTAEGAGNDIASILEGGPGPLVMTPVPRPGAVDGKNSREEEDSGTESASSSDESNSSSDDDSDGSDSSDDCE